MDAVAVERVVDDSSAARGAATPFRRAARLLGHPLTWCIVAIIATLWFVGFFALRFGYPLGMGGDHLFALKVLREEQQNIGRHNPFLGAPRGSDSLYFPLFDFTYKALSWLAGHAFPNVFRAAAALYGAGISLMVAMTFWSLIELSIPVWLATLASIAFVASPYFALRSFGHDYLALYFSVPAGAALPLVLAMAPDRGALLRRVSSPHYLVSTALAGCSGFYYGVFAGLFLILGTAMTAAARRDWRPIAIGCATAAGIVMLLVLTTYGRHVGGLVTHTVPPLPDRPAVEQFYHGLLLSDALLDFRGLGLWPARYAEYDQAIASPGLGDLPGESYAPEWPGPLLTATILASLVLAPVLAFAGSRQRGPLAAVVTISMSLCAFGVVFALRGGLGFVFAFTITSGLRAQERIVPFLAFFALVALCVAVTAALRKRRRLGLIAAGILLVLLTPGMKAAYHIMSTKQQAGLEGDTARADLRSIPAMLAAKNAAGLQMVLQMPVTFWPESQSDLGFDYYRDLLPYIMDGKDRPTRWSYGLAEKQPGFAELRAATAAGLPGLYDRATALGYDSVLIERQAMTAQDFVALDRQLRNEGAEAIYADPVRKLFRLPHP